jgi:Tol biopolymer transport system component
MAMRLARLMSLGLAVGAALGCGNDDQPALGVAAECGDEADLRLVFTGAAAEEGGDLFGLTDDGRVRRLTDDGGSFGPSFSPDGSRIVFSSIGDTGDVSDMTGPSGLDLYVISADGSGRRRLLDGDEDVSPAWSPDGDQIAFVRGGADDESGRIMVVNAEDEGSARVLVEHDGAAEDGYPAWSPDRAQLAFIRTTPDGRSSLMVVDDDGSDPRPVFDGDVPLGAPSWSPDGQRLAFQVGRSRDLSASVSVLDLHAETVATLLRPGTAPTWSTSGRLYAYSRAPGISDFSGAWRVAELTPDGAGGYEAGRAIAALDPIGHLYGDVRLDVPHCDGPDASALTTTADIADSVVVTDPETGADVAVLHREQALALLNRHLIGMPAGSEPPAKLIHTDAPDAAPLRLPPGRLVWVVMYEESPSGELGVVQLDATTGEFIGSGGVGSDEWEQLGDLAP